MARQKKQPQSAGEVVEYIGKRTKTGNSMGFRFESALFRSHPEFSGEVRARVVAPGELLIKVMREKVAEEDDPVLGPFLALLAKDMVENPQKIRPLDEERMREIAELTKGDDVSAAEDLGEEELLPWP